MSIGEWIRIIDEALMRLKPELDVLRRNDQSPKPLECGE